MKKMFRILLFLMMSSSVVCQEKVFDKTSNNLTLDGNVEFINKNLIEAESLYREAISQDSLNNIASYNMANSFYKSGLNMEAVNEYKSSILKAKNKGDLHRAYHNLGDVYMRNKDYQNAVTSFKKALLNNPSDDETRYNYVLAKELLKNDQKNKDKKDKKDDKKDKKDDKKDNKKQEKPQPNKISPEQLKNLLKAMNNEEKKVQEKVNKNKVKGVPVKNKKDW